MSSQTIIQKQIQEQREQQIETYKSMAEAYKQSKTIENNINKDININEELKNCSSYLMYKGYEAVKKEVIRPE